MQFYLFHAVEPSFEDTDEAVQDATYQAVAEGKAKSLDEVYGLSQNLDESWVDKAITVPHRWTIIYPQFPFASGHRSTSVGDIITMDDRVYVVSNFGFRDITGITWTAYRRKAPEEE